MSELVVRDASVWRGESWQMDDIVCRDGVIEATVDATGGVTEIDGTGLLAVPGFIDLQCNGALGIDLASEPDRLWELASALPRWGVTAWLPTIVSTPAAVAQRALQALRAGPPPGWAGAVPLALHLEGPFLARMKRGAHDPANLRAPSISEIDGWSRDAGVGIVTIAPELEGAREVIGALVERGVVVSLGHSAATAAQATAAVDAGASWVTHLFNAMSPFLHREPGLAGVALTDTRLRAGLISDGLHVHPTSVALAQRALGERLTLVTDAVAALGLDPGRHRLGRVEVISDDTGVRLRDGTLAGSNLSMDRAVRNLMRFASCPAEVAIAAASASPAALLGDQSRGSLVPGARADVVLLTQSLEVSLAIIGGDMVYDSAS